MEVWLKSSELQSQNNGLLNYVKCSICLQISFVLKPYIKKKNKHWLKRRLCTSLSLDYKCIQLVMQKMCKCLYTLFCCCYISFTHWNCSYERTEHASFNLLNYFHFDLTTNQSDFHRSSYLVSEILPPTSKMHKAQSSWVGIHIKIRPRRRHSLKFSQI